MDVFAGTADYYDQFRPGIPTEACDIIVRAAPAPITLLDIGPGTGRVLEQLAPRFTDIIAVEPSREMLKLAERRLFPYPVHFMNCDAEHMRLPEDWHASLVTICRAFHWLNRPLVLRKLEPVVAPQGVVAVCNESSFWELDEPWAAAAREVIRSFLGSERRTTRGIYQQPARPYTHDFAVSAFSHVERHTLPLVRHWTSDEIIGYLYSTSYASKELLGSRAPRFEETLKRELRAIAPDGLFTEHNEFEIFLARRPM